MPSNDSVKTGLALIEKDKSKVLGVTIGKHTVEPGLYIPRGDAQEIPDLSFNVPNADRSYLVVFLDLDPPFPSFPILGPALHWIQPGLKCEQKQGNIVMTSKDPFITDYAGPGPPPGSSPHRYCFFLYEEPAGFDVKSYAPPDGAKVGISKRMRYSLDSWEKKANLGPIVAANYFVSN